jgi:hypothetical protein
MRQATFRFFRQHLSWLLCLALLLPAAQVAAAVHALSHTQEATQASTQRDGADTSHLQACALCVVAGALGSHAPPVQLHLFTGAAAVHALPSVPLEAGVVSAAFALPRNRGPPTLLH